MLITSTLDLSATLGLIVTATFNCKGTGADFLALGGLGAVTPTTAPPTVATAAPTTAAPVTVAPAATDPGTLPRTGSNAGLLLAARGGAFDRRLVRPEGDEPALRRGPVPQLLDRSRRQYHPAGRPNGRPASRSRAHAVRTAAEHRHFPIWLHCPRRPVRTGVRTWGKDAPINSAGALPAHLSHEGGSQYAPTEVRFCTCRGRSSYGCGRSNFRRFTRGCGESV